MRLFHVSENEFISEFVPRTPDRDDLDPDMPLVWAIDEEHLANYLTPRDCPRVAYHVTWETSEDDRRRFFTSPTHRDALVIESGWFEIMRGTTLWLYEFAPQEFELQDAAAGYYTAKTTQTPIGKYCIDDLFAELFLRGVEVRIVDNLHAIADEVERSTLAWSCCRMRNAVDGEVW